MTYKNTKFEDSPVMRSLEKLAQKKGLIKNDPFKKEASAPAPSYVPTENLNQNILKLCSGLRSQGFGRYASELESKFLALKSAENILEEAHPEGSVTLKDMEGDATVEDCADQKKMIEDIIKKTPKGKFGHDIVNLVKITLGSGGSSTAFSFVSKNLLPELTAAAELIEKDNNAKSVKVLTSIKSATEFVSRLTQDSLASEIDRITAMLTTIKQELSAYSAAVKGEWFGDANLNADLATIKIDGTLHTCGAIRSALKMESGENKTAKFLREVTSELAKVNKLNMMVQTLTDNDDKASGGKWIEFFNEKLNELKNNPHLKNVEISDRMADKLQPAFDKLKAQIADFDSKL